MVDLLRPDPARRTEGLKQTVCISSAYLWLRLRHDPDWTGIANLNDLINQNLHLIFPANLPMIEL